MSRHATVRHIAKADPALKAEVYQDLGIRLEYRHEERRVKVEFP